MNHDLLISHDPKAVVPGKTARIRNMRTISRKYAATMTKMLRDSTQSGHPAIMGWKAGEEESAIARKSNAHGKARGLCGLLNPIQVPKTSRTIG